MSGIVACPQSIMKLHPDFDAIFHGILSGSTDAQIVLIHDSSKPAGIFDKARVLHRLSRILSKEQQSRLHIVDRLSSSDFLRLMRIAEIILDPFPFGGGVTSLEAFAVCGVIVTSPRLQSVVELTAGMYRRMGVHNAPVVGSSMEYIEVSLNLLRNSTQREILRKEICDRRNVLFHDIASIDEWGLFLSQIS
jgi:predicted O-linked N-acetylglucosamine transferase (SPINDLY family)